MAHHQASPATVFPHLSQVWIGDRMDFELFNLVVARDGIEPPTPAFSGPRSTTELPGLSADFRLHLLCGIPADSLLQRLE